MGVPRVWANPAETVDFEKSIVPLISANCLGCHNDSEVAGELILATREGALKGGQTRSALVPGDTKASFLLERVRLGEMPPEGNDPLTEDQIHFLESWIRQGASWPADREISPYESTTAVRGGKDWWSFQPIQRPALPDSGTDAQIANPIDAFVFAQLRKQDMAPAPAAEKRTLIRRVYFDLIGLPPSPDVVRAFERDGSPRAYEQVVDGLLASPRFGERWARYWLDLVGYADTNGYERDAEKPNMWKYRDWIIRSLNEDKPYDRFLTEQLAGDELPDRSEETVVATGMLRVGTWNDEPNDPGEYKYERLADMIHATSTAFLGVTVKCARCHDHKFDPVPQRDYYRMANLFWAGFMEPGAGKLMGGPDPEQLGFAAFGWTDRGREAEPIRLLTKGDPNRPGSPVEPGFLSLVSSLDRPLAEPPEDAGTTRRRLQFAEWLCDRQHPLTARVMVNRLWLHHFGEGLVRTPNNFGFKGDLPTHPELLDWLADELMAGGWKLKRLHKLMVMSNTYRQASIHPRQDEYAERDFSNRYLWRANRRRLDADALRDSMLDVSGELNLTIGGPGFTPRVSKEALEGLSKKSGAWKQSSLTERRRRSVYMYLQRSLLLPLMTTFDFRDTTQPCGRRDVTTVAPQALALLNNAFVHEMSEAFARRIIEEVGDVPRDLATRAWQVAFGREPTETEVAAAVDHLGTQHANFSNRLQAIVAERAVPAKSPPDGSLVLWLKADEGVSLDGQNRVKSWEDHSPAKHHASQEMFEARPVLVNDAIRRQPAIRFDGNGRFMHLAGEVLQSQQCTIIAVASDQVGDGPHRGIFSNWNGSAGNSTTSIFLGTTRNGKVRLSDDFVTAPSLMQPGEPFLLTAVAGSDGAMIYQGTDLLADKGSPVAQRNLKTPYVIGQQGNINGEYWNGDIAELLVYDRALDPSELEEAWGYLNGRYGLWTLPEPPEPTTLASSSLCHVLLNANEFLYVD
jgi:hypothetical protein